MPDVVYVTVPEYQPSSASITIGDPFYGASQQNQQITVRRTALNTTTIASLIVVAVIGIGVAYWALKK